MIRRSADRHAWRAGELQHNGERIEAFVRRDEGSQRKMGKRRAKPRVYAGALKAAEGEAGDVAEP